MFNEERLTLIGCIIGFISVGIMCLHDVQTMVFFGLIIIGGIGLWIYDSVIESHKATTIAIETNEVPEPIQRLWGIEQIAPSTTNPISTTTTIYTQKDKDYLGCELMVGFVWECYNLHEAIALGLKGASLYLCPMACTPILTWNETPTNCKPTLPPMDLQLFATTDIAPTQEEFDRAFGLIRAATMEPEINLSHIHQCCKCMGIYDNQNRVIETRDGLINGASHGFCLDCYKKEMLLIGLITPDDTDTNECLTTTPDPEETNDEEIINSMFRSTFPKLDLQLFADKKCVISNDICIGCGDCEEEETPEWYDSADHLEWAKSMAASDPTQEHCDFCGLSIVHCECNGAHNPNHARPQEDWDSYMDDYQDIIHDLDEKDCPF